MASIFEKSTYSVSTKLPIMPVSGGNTEKEPIDSNHTPHFIVGASVLALSLFPFMDLTKTLDQISDPAVVKWDITSSSGVSLQKVRHISKSAAEEDVELARPNWMHERMAALEDRDFVRLNDRRKRIG
jgi:hypothetical protein